MIKKILIGLGILIVLTLAFAIAAPFLFKGKIVAAINDAANDNVNAEVQLGDYDLTLFSSFPNLTVAIENVTVKGIDQFQGIKLADIKELAVTVDIMSLIKGGKMEIVSVGLSNPEIHVIVLEDGMANWDIAKAGEETTEEEEALSAEEESEFSMTLQEYYIRNAHVVYDDREGGMYAELVDFTHEGRGDFTLDVFDVRTRTTAEAITYQMDGIAFLNQVNTEIDFDINVDLPNEKYTFGENTIRLNQLQLGFEGFVALVGEAIDMDVAFHTLKTEFSSVLSLVPAVYARDFADIETKGKLALDGMAKGRYEGDNLPGFDVKLIVENGYFHYPDLPKAAENIQVNVEVANPGGDADLTTVDINTFHVDLAKQPVDMVMHIKTPVSDAFVDGGIKAKLVLDELKDVIPMEEGESYSGEIKANIGLRGNVSALENEQYDQFEATGRLQAKKLRYQDPTTPYDMLINSMDMEFAPQFVELADFDAQIGKSDMRATGRIDNLLAYWFNDDVLKGSFDLNSNLMDLNEFIEEEEATAEGESGASGEGEGTEEESSEGVAEVPGNLDFVLTTNIGKMLYDNIEMTAVKGGVIIRDQRATLQNLSMDMLKGNLVMNGGYDTKVFNQPKVDFDLDITRFDVQEPYTTFNTVQKLAPIAESAKGAFSTTLGISGTMDENMEMVMNTVNGNGRLKTHEVRVEGAGVLSKVGDVLKNDDFKKLELDNTNISFKIVNGEVEVDPFDFDLANGKGTMKGVSRLDQTIDYNMQLKLPLSAMGGAANIALGSLISAANSKGANLSAGEMIDAEVLITGTMSDPKIRPVWPGGTGEGSLTDDLKNQAKQKVEEVKTQAIDEGRKKAKEEADKILAEGRKRSQQVKDEARKQADAVRKEGDKQADDLIKQAGNNPLKKKAAKVAADKVRKEADKKANKLVSEADKKADGIMQEAQRKADERLKQP
ncbi:MAG: AsmA-like C-terminal region-containing protein [Salibacteraceae bacterium]